MNTNLNGARDSGFRAEPEPVLAGTTTPQSEQVDSVINIAGIPAEMKAEPKWVGFRTAPRGNGKLNKFPINPHTNGLAQVNNPSTWGTLEDALDGVARGAWLGVGYVLTLENHHVAIDLDDVRDPASGELEPLAERIIARLNSYTEVTLSGRGVHIWCHGTLPSGAVCHKGKIEMYTSGRHMVMTGQVLSKAGDISISTSIESRQAEIDALQAWLAKDARVVESLASDPLFSSLWTGPWEKSGKYESQNEADLALCNMLAPRCNYDAAQMDRIFPWSGLMRPKWDEKHSADGRTYGQMTIQKALGERAEKIPAQQATVREIKAARTWSAEEFLDRRFEAKEPLIEGLLHKRDLVALAGRRREGKTTLAVNLGVALAIPSKEFLGYPIPKAGRSLLLLLEDDAGELQDKLKRITDGRTTDGRLRIVTRDDFYEAGIQIDIREDDFREAITRWAQEHTPDLIVIDNLAHVIAAEYNDAKRVHELMNFCYRLAKAHNCAIVLCAHPKKESQENPLHLEHNPTAFFESVMGSSHFVNSTGSLWGVQREVGQDYSVFVGGRQRADGEQGAAHIFMDEKGWLQIVDDGEANRSLVLNTEGRRQAWDLLPATFGYNEGERIVKPVMRSSDTFNKWIKQCRRLRVILDAPDGKLMKAGSAKKGEPGEAKKVA